MTIKYKNFILQPGNAKDRFDIIQIKSITAQAGGIAERKGVRKAGEVYEKKEEIAYDMLLENAIDKIIRLSLSENKDTVDLKTYVEEYKKQITELKNILK
jgi:hypothetical protein